MLLTFLRGLDEVCQLLHGVGQLLYEVNFRQHQGVWQAGTKPFDLLSLQPALIFIGMQYDVHC